MTALYGGYVGSLSWFVNKSTLPDDFEGESGKAFFGGGEGTSESPYQIKNARHFYNLCWLQYLGRFNKDTNNDKVIDQVYFQLKNDIDCSTLGSALPPIGTTRYPFVGNFNGNDHIVKNYTITDKYSELTKHPSIIDTENTYYTQGNTTINYCSIIGTFGVIGYNTTGATDVVSSEASLYGFTKDQLKVNSVDNLYIDNVTIKPATKNTLAGLLAGYVSANMSGCGVHYSQFNFDNNTNISSKFNNKLSNYALIGDYNSDEYKWSDVQTSGNNIGGSLDIFSLSKRISYMTQNIEKTNSNMFFESDKWHLAMGLSSGKDSYDYTDTSNGNSAMLIYNTYLPLNVNQSDIIDTFYSTTPKKEESILTNKNTGYIVGGGNEDQRGYGSAEVRLRNQICKKDSNGLDNSFKDKTNVNSSNKDTILSDSNINLWYYDSINNKSNIITSSTKENFVKINEAYIYDTVKKNLITMLKDSTIIPSTPAYYAICPGFYMRKQSSATDLENHILTGKNVHIYEDTYSSYDFYTGGINFSLNEDGHLTIVLANYANSSTGFFDIYKVDRTTSTTSSGKTSTLNGYHKISKISKTKTSNTNDYSYGYLYSDNSQSNFDSNNVIFSFENNKSSINARSLYYFEIPLTSGDYFYSIPQGISNSPYTIYINIGANSSSSSESSKGEINKVDFVYEKDGKLVQITDDNKSKIVFDISGNGKTYFYFKRSETIGVLFFSDDTTLTINPTISGTVKCSLATDKSCTVAK